MKWLLSVVVLMVVLANPATAAETPIRVVGADDLIVSSAAAAPADGRLRLLERRRMGLTVRNVVRVLQDMKASGELAQYVSPGDDGSGKIDISNLAVAVAGELASERPEDWSDLDFDQILEWIERVLQLILEYLPLIIELFLGLL